MIAQLQETNAPLGKLPSHFVIFLSALLLLFAAACAGEDPSGGSTDNQSGAECVDDVDCDPGSVCTPSGACISESCDWCQNDQICYVSSNNPEGTCSAAACSSDADCGDNYDCVDGTCSESSSCSSSSDCDEGEICSPAGNCIEGNGGSTDECQTDTDCDPGESCDNGNCVDDGGNGGECEMDPGMCSGATPHLDEVACQCVECTTTSHCSGNDICNNGQCVDDSPTNPGTCDTPCSQNQPGTCSHPTPYCIDDCCVECIGPADCSGGYLCEDNACIPPSGCGSDADCPSGYECDSGTCSPPEGGQSCDPEDPMSCPDGQVCNDGTCEVLGGGDCGLCNPDCTCPGDAVCDGFLCTGCDMMAAITGGEDGCPDGQECLFGLCFPL